MDIVRSLASPTSPFELLFIDADKIKLREGSTCFFDHSTDLVVTAKKNAEGNTPLRYAGVVRRSCDREDDICPTDPVGNKSVLNISAGIKSMLDMHGGSITNVMRCHSVFQDYQDHIVAVTTKGDACLNLIKQELVCNENSYGISLVGKWLVYNHTLKNYNVCPDNPENSHIKEESDTGKELDVYYNRSQYCESDFRAPFTPTSPYIDKGGDRLQSISTIGYITDFLCPLNDTDKIVLYIVI